MTSLLGNLTLSPNFLSIFYADLFTINGKNWLITGEGKSQAARIASNNDEVSNLGEDAIALIRVGDDLFAHYDLGAVGINPTAPVLNKVDAIAYCVPKKHTAKVFAATGLVIVEADSNLVAPFASGNEYSGSAAEYFVSPEQWDNLNNPLRLTQVMIGLTNGVTSSKFLMVPYMPSLQDKAMLYQNYVL